MGGKPLGVENRIQAHQTMTNDTTMTTTTRKVQNPDNLTPEQVGEGYRLTFEDERGLGNHDERIEIWVSPSVGWQRRIDYPSALSRKRCYRIPLDGPTPPPPERFTIKPLAWEKGSHSSMSAQTAWGPMRYGRKGSKAYLVWWGSIDGETIFPTLEDAKAAAEAAYIARVKELLDPA